MDYYQVQNVEFTSKEVSRLTNIHPEALEFHAVQISLLRLPWEHLLLNTGRLDLYPGHVFGQHLRTGKYLLRMEGLNM